jgi:DNA-binding LytR/AlgR family response regulator
LVDYTLTELEGRLASAFARASWADLVSLAHAEKFVPESDGSARLTLRDAGEVRVSRRRTSEIRRWLEQLA